MNIYDIAGEAGVSIATVSRVINGKRAVSAATRQKVEEVLTRHHYVPDQIARGLVTKSTRTIAVMTIDIRDIYYANVAYTIEQELSHRSYSAILCNTGNDIQNKMEYIRNVLRQKVEAIVFVGSVFRDGVMDEAIRNVAARIPVVMVNGFVEADNIYSVICDDRLGVVRAVEYLAQKGRRRIAYLKSADTFSARSKAHGFCQAVKSPRERMIEVERSIRGGYTGAGKFLQWDALPDAVICDDDITAVGVLKCLSARGVAVPGDISVVGFNNSLLAECCTPSLTSVDSLMVEMGRTAVATLLEVLAGKKPQPRITFAPDIRLRESS